MLTNTTHLQKSGAYLSYNAAVLSAYDDYYDAILSTLETDYSTTLTNEQLVVAEAYEVYASAYTSILASELDSELAENRADLVATTEATDSLNDALVDAEDAYNASYLAALGLADMTDAISSYLASGTTASANYTASIATAFGDFQLGTREDRLVGVTVSNPRYSAYACDEINADLVATLDDAYDDFDYREALKRKGKERAAIWDYKKTADLYEKELLETIKAR